MCEVEHHGCEPVRGTVAVVDDLKRERRRRLLHKLNKEFNDDLSCWNVGVLVDGPVGGEDRTVFCDPSGGTVGSFVQERSRRTQRNIANATALLSP